MNLKASICEIDLNKEDSVSALARVGMSLIPEKVVLKKYVHVLLNIGSRGS